MPVQDPNSIKRRIIAMKQAHPEMMPAGIAKALGTTRKYANHVLSDMLMTKGYSGEEGQHRGVTAKQIGAGRRPTAGYTKLI